ncbi:MAG: alanine dehydrogenase [Bacteroidetes bacterium]|nr:alanine dehydrogenase [Bacteroidota bacterium]
MSKNIKVGILKETKTPPDRRVAVAPEQAIELLNKFSNVELFFQPSDIRCYSDEEYKELGLNIEQDLSSCDILIGVKEVTIDALIANKKYLFFSHTAKEQTYNRELLQEVLRKNITLIDYEYLTDEKNIRLVAFGRWAGLVGAYNSLIGFGKRTGLFSLKSAHDCHDMKEMFSEVEKLKLPPVKILISGGGRVAHGAMETLAPLNIKKVTPDEFINKTFDEAVFCQIDPWDYAKRKDGGKFDLQNFFYFPAEYETTFLPYTKVTDVFIACHFWNEKSPVFMTNDDMKADDFKMQVIADVSCDIAGPIPSTIRPSTIAEPFYGYNAKLEKEAEPFDKNNITVMAVDNLPGELPRDASVDFGKGLIEKVYPSLFGDDKEEIIKRATIAKDGKLTEKYAYLQNYVDGK